MVVKVYISGISGNKEVKKRQQRVLLILDSKNIKYELIDIAEPGNDEHKEFMQNNSKSSGGTVSDPEPRHPLPPQIFNDDEYCGDYDQFDLANEIDEMEKFLKLAPDDSAPTVTSTSEVKLGNGVGNVNTETNELKDTDNKMESTENGENKEEKIENGETEENSEVEVKKDNDEVKEDEKESTPAKEEVKDEADSKDEENQDDNDEKADEEES